MQSGYTYTLNSGIQNNLIRIEAAKKIIDFLPQLPHVEEVLRSRSLLKSSLFSAKIEGNMLEFNEVQSLRENNTQDKEKKEVFNILSALKWVYASTSSNLTSAILLTYPN